MDVIGAQMGFEDIVHDGLLITGELPFKLGEFWTGGLGDFISEDVERHSVKVVAHGQARGSRTLGGSEMRHLNDRITYFRMALAMLGAKASDHTTLRGGYNSDGELRIYGASPMEQGLYQFKESKRVFCNRSTLESALGLAATIGRVYTDPTKWHRLRRILNTFYRACTEHDPYERMHMFVRTLDGVVMTRQRRGQSDFATRMAIITGAVYRTMLGEAYALRSATAHLNDLPGALKRARRANEQLLFLELVSVETLRRILTDPALLLVFEANSAIEAFWLSSPKWTPKIQVPNVQRARAETWERRFEDM